MFLREHRDTDATEPFVRTLLGHTGGKPPERTITDKLGS